MIPMWKIRREWKRLSRQIMLPWVYLNGPRQRRLHDESNAQIRTQGDVPYGENVALFLVYQPNGLPASLLKTCAHLRDNGFTILIVSNAPLAAADIAALKPLASEIMERPNFGYDFGGYRDGILHLLDLPQSFDNLLILNDSIWFPVTDNSTLLADTLAQTHDIYGAIWYDHQGTNTKSHLQSYYINFGKAAVADPKFHSYWRNKKLYAGREAAIRRGEKRLTTELRALGFSIGWRYETADKWRALQRLSTQELQQVLKFEAKNKSRFARQAADLLSSDPNNEVWKQRAQTLMKQSPHVQYLLNSHPSILRDLELSFLKKDRNVPYQNQRAALVKSGFFQKFDPQIAIEIQTWDKK